MDSFPETYNDPIAYPSPIHAHILTFPRLHPRIAVLVILSKIVGRVILKVSWSLSLHLFMVFDPSVVCYIKICRLPIEISFTATKQNEVNFNVLCHVKKKTSPLTLNVKAERETNCVI